MVLTWIYTSLLCVLMVDWSHAECPQSTLTSKATQNCVEGFFTYIGSEVSSGSDPSQIDTIFCSPEGQSAIECIFPLIEQCPELMANISDGSKGIPSQAELQMACSKMSAEVCMETMTCLSYAPQVASMGIDENFRQANNLTYLLPLIGLSCGPMKEHFYCISPATEEACKTIPDEMDTMITLINGELPDGFVFPEYHVLKTFIYTGCRDAPDDMATNKCVHDNLESTAFTECMSKVKTDFKTPIEMKSCGATDARLMCLEESVVKQCGRRYYYTLTTMGDRF
ncbi:hypothetical protein MAR_012976, partial [Mya arenaria]